MTWPYGSPVAAKVRDAALISEGHITALNNMRMQSYIGSFHPPPNFLSYASFESIAANENERPLVSDFIPLTQIRPAPLKCALPCCIFQDLSIRRVEPPINGAAAIDCRKCRKFC